MEFRNQLKAFLGNMPIVQLAQGRVDMGGNGLLERLRGMPVFDADAGAREAFDSGLGALTAAGAAAKRLRHGDLQQLFNSFYDPTPDQWSAR